jgi:hypothetical protein
MKVPKIKPEWLVGITMTRAQKARWLAALRSGEYRQCKGFLTLNGGFCCLGVYAHAVHNFPVSELFYKASLTGTLQIFDLGNDFANSIQSELGLMNDDHQSFSQIADFIEQHIPACDEARS